MLSSSSKGAFPPSHFAANLPTDSHKMLPHKQMSQIHFFVMFVSQKFAADKIGLPQIDRGNFLGEFVSKFVAKM
jgi:hypothetical protein